MTRHPLLPAFAVVAVAASGFLAACGLDTEEAGRGAAVTMTQTTAQTNASGQTAEQQRAIQRRRAALPKPPDNTVVVAGERRLGISPTVARAFEGSSSVDVSLRDLPENRAFRALCDGQVDVVESERLMSSTEVDRCRQNGIDLLTDASGRVRPLQLAAEGIVIATRNQSDVGGDCLRLSTVRDMFRSGSPFSNWSQIGFDSLPLTTSGRDDKTDTFQLFGDLVLGAEGAASLSDVRRDYKVRDTDANVREEIVHDRAIRAARRRAQQRLERRLRTTQPRRRRAVDAAVRAADRRLLRVVREENRRLRRSKRTLTPAQADALERRNLRRFVEAKRIAGVEANNDFTAEIVSAEQRLLNQEVERLRRSGTVGFFRFTYYELYEEDLRPMEIWDPVTSQATFEGRGIATNRTRIQSETDQRTGSGALTGASNRQTATRTTKPTPKTPGTTYVAASGNKVTVPAGGPVDVDNTPSCIFPSRRTVSSGVYPLSTRLLAYTTRRALQRRETRDYLSFYLDEGQGVVEQNRLIPLDDNLAAEEYEAVTGRRLQPDEEEEDGSSTTSTTSTTTTPEAPITTTPATTPTSPSGAIPGVSGGGGR